MRPNPFALFRSLLVEYGEVHVVGSYALRLMTWRDLDIHVVQEAPDAETFFALGGRLAKLLKLSGDGHRWYSVAAGGLAGSSL